MKLKKTYKFAIKSSFFIALFALGLMELLFWIFSIDNWLIPWIVFWCVGTFSFFIIQYRVERFIYRGIKKIYDDVSLLDASSLIKQPITTDMTTLTKQVSKFATDKKLEIETLKLQEQYRRDYIGNISHELKTPLFTVQGYISTLLEGGINDKSIRKKYLQRAEKGVERLIYIVNDLDLITQLETGSLHLNFTRFDIVEVIQNVFDLLEYNASKKNIILLFDMKYIDPIWVVADKDKIQQVITNLILNSIKYGKENGTTEVSIEEFVSNKILIRVIDNGNGIESKHIPRLFERFYRIDKSGGRNEGGSGLGLSIVKHIIEAHDEKIYVNAEVGKGSEFSFTLERSNP